VHDKYRFFPLDGILAQDDVGVVEEDKERGRPREAAGGAAGDGD